MNTRTLLAALSLGLLVALPVQAQDSSPGIADTAYVAGEYRVYRGDGSSASLDDVVAAMGAHEVVFVGETHDDPTAHFLENELLTRAHAAYAPRPIALSLEFFQRDVQPILDEYLDGLITEKAFLKDSRPWPRYETDYRPMIEFSLENDLNVVAANAPRRYANRVTLHGRESLEDLSAEAKATLAPLPYGEASEAYRDQWIQSIMEVMEEERMKCGVPIPESELEASPSGGSAHGNMGGQLHSQVLWDATMAYWVTDQLVRHPDALVLHMVGSFHVARGTGIPEQIERYRPGTSSMIVMLRAVSDVDAFEPAPAGEWGDFVIQTDESRTLEELECRAQG
ncbi:MAG: hypothetical protein E4H28_02600 [Gemmatimonadales bacterium]|nr:MAG: hypothetical protein E4H28_02600 [Gemmatimonadales bacterium]